jgi:hypothetical protein
VVQHEVVREPDEGAAVLCTAEAGNLKFERCRPKNIPGYRRPNHE